MNKLIEFLDSCESSASALVMVKSFYDDVDCLSDGEVTEIYNNSEGTNDSLRDELLHKLNPTQLLGLYELVLEISMEISMEKHEE